MPSSEEIRSQLVPLPAQNFNATPMIAPLAPSQDTISDQLGYFYRPGGLPMVRHSPLPVAAQAQNVANSTSIAQTQASKAIFGNRNINQITVAQGGQGTAPNLAAGRAISLTTNALGIVTVDYTGFLGTPFGETISIGAGTNTGTLSHAVNTSSFFIFSKNGVTLQQGGGNDFTISGTTITLAVNAVAGDIFVAFYFF